MSKKQQVSFKNYVSGAQRRLLTNLYQIANGISIAFGLFFKAWTRDYELILSIWKGRFPETAERQPLSILERIAMTILLLLRSFSLANIRHLFQRYTVRSEVSEFYVVAWVIILFVLLWYPTTCLPLLYGLVAYRLIDSLNYRLCIVFVDRYSPEWGLRSVNRSLILIALNYLETVLAFAILYMHTQSISTTVPSLRFISSSGESFHFSLMTILTLSFGELRPVTAIGKALVVLEPVLGLVLIALFVGFLVQGLTVQEKRQ